MWPRLCRCLLALVLTTLGLVVLFGVAWAIPEKSPRGPLYLDGWTKDGLSLILVQPGPRPQRYRLSLDGELFLPLITSHQSKPDSSVGASPPSPTTVTQDETLVIGGPGGSYRLSLPPSSTVQALTWSDAGKRLAYVTTVDGLFPTLWIWSFGDTDAQPVARGELTHFSRPRWSPDGTRLVFARIPTGSQTADAATLWLVELTDGGPKMRFLEAAGMGAHTPRWSPDSARLAFQQGQSFFVLDILTDQVIPVPLPDRQELPASSSRASVVPTGVLTPPLIIRVVHHPDNSCRHVPDWQVDVFPFEEYVQRVVPSEMPALWPMATLQAQAIAARTYAWYQVLVGRDEWDVTDWADFQIMCDRTHPRSDAAVTTTVGQYVAYQGQVILAQYSAENGHPTLAGGSLPYLRPVADLVSLGQVRRGHGHGMGQWGAYRWVTWHGWDYQRILDHYYTDVTIELPVDGVVPLLMGLLDPPPDGWLMGNRVYLRANASATSTTPITMTFIGTCQESGGIMRTLWTTDTNSDDGWAAVWDCGVSPPTPPMSATMAITAVATNQYGVLVTDTARLRVDHEPPIGQVTFVTSENGLADSITATLIVSGVDQGASGLASVGFSNGWLWEGEDLFHRPGTGIVISDATALNGYAWWFRAGVDRPDWAYGPYTDELPPGKLYRAYFRLRSHDAYTTARVAYLDVADDAGATLLGLRWVRGLDFRFPDTYQEFPVDFWYPELGSTGLEFRVRFLGIADLALDRVLVTSLPQTVASAMNWRLSPGEGSKQVIAKLVDAAGNPSIDITASVQLVDRQPPHHWRLLSPTGWISQTPTVTATAQVEDEISGLAPTTAAYSFSNDGGQQWSEWQLAATSALTGSARPETLSALAIPLGGEGADRNQVRFRVADVRGHLAESPAYPIARDLTPPQITAHLSREPVIAGWYTAPVTVTLIASDTVSDLAGIHWSRSGGAMVTYTRPFTLADEGQATIEYRVWDSAGNTQGGNLTIGIDRHPPTATITVPLQSPTSLIPVSWAGTDANGSGVVAFDVEVRQIWQSDWLRWQTATQQRHGTFLGRPGQAYAFRVRAFDAVGHLSPWSVEQLSKVKVQGVYMPFVISVRPATISRWFLARKHPQSS
ncbi:MAG TPA: SpoIID/LytB domain-containing protein [Anaerolineae bacterium]|nr:SpoIID/LytB domain-containing protein [Anaerolineae bacterium]